MILWSLAPNRYLSPGIALNPGTPGPGRHILLVPRMPPRMLASPSRRRMTCSADTLLIMGSVTPLMVDGTALRGDLDFDLQGHIVVEVNGRSNLDVHAHVEVLKLGVLTRELTTAVAARSDTNRWRWGCASRSSWWPSADRWRECADSAGSWCSCRSAAGWPWPPRWSPQVRCLEMGQIVDGGGGCGGRG